MLSKFTEPISVHCFQTYSIPRFRIPVRTDCGLRPIFFFSFQNRVCRYLISNNSMQQPLLSDWLQKRKKEHLHFRSLLLRGPRTKITIVFSLRSALLNFLLVTNACALPTLENSLYIYLSIAIFP